MEEFLTIPEIFIKEEPIESKLYTFGKSIDCDEASNATLCPNEKIQINQSNFNNLETYKYTEPEDAIIDDAAVSLILSTSNSLNSPTIDDFSENKQENATACLKESDGYDPTSFEDSFPIFKVEAELGNSSDSEGVDTSIEDENIENNITEDQQDLYEPFKKEAQRKKNFKICKEKKFECPLCHKLFKTSSAMNGHVSKGHKTTLGEKFVCHVCGSPGSSRASLKRHLIRTHKILNVDHPELLTKKCLHCGVGFASHQRLYEHIRLCHEDQLRRYHHCQWCPALMKAKGSLIRHVRRAHPDNEDFYSATVSCSVCNVNFANIPLLQRHMKKVHPNNNKNKCTTCSASFKFPYLLSKHQVLHEDPVKYLEYRKKRKYSVNCEFCGKTYDSKPRLHSHLKNVHSDPSVPQSKVYTCRLCGSGFPTAKQNNRHYRRVHRPERQKVHCGKCNITFKTPQECNEHRAIHPNTCEICQKQFLRRDSLREHLMIHSAPRHQCPHCDKKFTQRSNLKRHIRVHTGEKPYRCLYCSRSFSDKSACNSHTRVHTGYERSICTICGASFSKKQRLNYHMRIHSGQGLLHCPLCSRTCTTSYAIRKHLESHLVPLTKALKSLGFGPLLYSNPSFVENALHAVTQATLKESMKNASTSADKIQQDQDGLNSVGAGPDSACPLETTGSIFIKKLEVKNIENSMPSEKVTFKTEQENSDGEETDFRTIEDHENINFDDRVSNNDSTTSFNLIKFLQGILEKESLKIINKRRLRNRNKFLINYNDEIYSQAEEENCDLGINEGEELPETIGDELVKQCLEIVMNDQGDSNEFESENSEIGLFEKLNEYNDYSIMENNENNSLKCEGEVPLATKNAQLCAAANCTNEDNESDDKVGIDNLPNSSFRGIPKLKISRIASMEDNYFSKNIFMAEIIEKD